MLGNHADHQLHQGTPNNQGLQKLSAYIIFYDAPAAENNQGADQ